MGFMTARLGSSLSRHPSHSRPLNSSKSAIVSLTPGRFTLWMYLRTFIWIFSPTQTPVVATSDIRATWKSRKISVSALPGPGPFCACCSEEVTNFECTQLRRRLRECKEEGFTFLGMDAS
jgi:hypothetical protein